MRKRMLRERQAQEEAYSRVNRLKIMNQWRKLMRLVKVEDLRKEIEIISQNHEREVDRKDAIIQMLDRDLEDSEEQYQTALRSHLLIVDKLIDLHNSRLRGLEFEFERDLQELVEEFGTERDEINATHATHKKEMLDIMALMEAEFNEQEGEARQEFESRARRSRTRTRRSTTCCASPSRGSSRSSSATSTRRTPTTWRRRSSGRRTSRT